MGSECDSYVLWSRIYSALILLWGIRACWSHNDEVTVLLKLRSRIHFDPHGALANWKPDDVDPCDWKGVQCVDSTVQRLNLSGMSLEGKLAPELGKLRNLKYLELSGNKFSGTIPKEFGGLNKLELLDLSNNNLSGSVPIDIGSMLSLKDLSLSGNNIEFNVPQDLGKLELLSKPQLIDNHADPQVNEIGCMNRKLGHWFKLRNYHNREENFFDNQHSVSAIRRKLFDQSSNLAAAPFNGELVHVKDFPHPLSSGSFPATKAPSPAPSTAPAPAPEASNDNASGNGWKYLIIILGVLVLVFVVAALYCLWNKRAIKVIGPWKTGLSGQLQKAFVTGVPKLDRSEVEVACEEFSNIVACMPHCNVYKGTLSSKVEIAVSSTLITSVQDWSKDMEIDYRKQIEVLSRINHKNFINLIGYCDEQEPFTRMTVTEYASNGSLFEYLHDGFVNERPEQPEWDRRMRIIMGVAYCLRYLHHDLNPPIAHCNLNSHSVLLTDDFAAKVVESIFIAPSTEADRLNSKNSEKPPKNAYPETNVYCFGKLLFEIISGKLPDSKEHEHLEKLAGEFVNGKRSISYMIDPSLESYDDKQLEVICEVIYECTQHNPCLRPTMKDITSKLRHVIDISPAKAGPQLSPLWWLELEILSEEAM